MVCQLFQGLEIVFVFIYILTFSELNLIDNVAELSETPVFKDQILLIFTGNWQRLILCCLGEKLREAESRQVRFVDVASRENGTHHH